ncbi:MAG: DUF5680 domain-containing protein [Nanoarchaeota archaeon]|nr:DUF5680 domain-containing protein [Nanoarchaeota archaeon]
MELKKFLVKAKISTYATGGESKEVILEDGSEELTYKEKKFKYRDRYFGHNPFIGEEIVWKNKKILWAMNYYGNIIDKKIPSKEVYNFLKDVLKKVTEDLPFRGPKIFKKENFKYINEVDGDISNFSGKEIIYYNNKMIYFLHYHGGFIRNKTIVTPK